MYAVYVTLILFYLYIYVFMYLVSSLSISYRDVSLLQSKEKRGIKQAQYMYVYTCDLI